MPRTPLLSKRQSETHIVEFEFREQLAFGESLSAPVVTVSVFTGFDYDVADLLSGGASVSGTVVSQKVKEGMAGAIYVLLCVVTGSSGNVYRTTRRLAVLSDVGGFADGALPSLTGSLPDGVVGAPYSAPLQISGGYPPYSPVGIIAGAPSWMGFTVVDDELICAGTPDEAAATTYNFSPEIFDQALNHATSPQSIDITRIIVSGAAPDSIVGSTVDFFYTAAFGTPPYTFPVTPAGFPPSWVLGIDGHVTGTSTSPGSFSWEIIGVDANGVTDLHPDNANVTIAEMFTSQANETYLRRSIDAGASWPLTVETGGPAVTEDALVFTIANGMAQRHTPIMGRHSFNGTVWADCTIPGGTGFPMWLIFTAGTWIRRSVGGVQASANGILFTNVGGVPSLGIPDLNFRSVAYNGNSIVSAYQSGANRGILASADGGATWVAYIRGLLNTYQTLIFLPAPYNYYLGFTGAAGRVDKTVTGMADLDWTNNFSTIATPNAIVSAAYSTTLGRLLIADALVGILRYSDNGGVSWNNAPGFGEAVVFTRLFWLQGKFWALTSNNSTVVKIWYSVDGLAWTQAYSEPIVSLTRQFTAIASF